MNPTGRIGPTAAGARPAMNPTGRIAPAAAGARPAMDPAGRLPLRYFSAKPENNSGFRTVAAAMRLTGAPVPPWAPSGLPAGFWCPRERAAAFVLSWLPVAGCSFPVGCASGGSRFGPSGRPDLSGPPDLE